MFDPLDSQLIPEELRAALRFSPDNGPLLEHVAEIALTRGGLVEAEALFKRALAINRTSTRARLGLGNAFLQQGKHGPAMVIAEELVKLSAPPPRAWLLHARLALLAGEPVLAAREYKKARSADPALVDATLEESLASHLHSTPLKPEKAEPPLSFSSSTEETPDSSSGPIDQIAPRSDAFELERPRLSFADVGGMERVKEEVEMKIILPLRQPDLFKSYGKKIGGGILLYGPPGCGKTYLARATAGEVNANFLAIGINDVLDMWVGQSEKNLHSLFEQARNNRPCVLFFDEVDALGAHRADMLKSGGRQIINQFLSELDGVTASNEGVLILAATNTPWHLDPAFRRPGRFDRILFVPPPDAAARSTILQLLLRDRPVKAIDVDVVAKKTDGYSGADLKAVVDVAVESKLRDAMRAGSIQPLVMADLLDAVKRHKPTVRDWFETARNHALYANQSGLYDDVLSYLKIAK